MKTDSCVLKDSVMTWCGREIDEEESRFPRVPHQIPNMNSDEVCQRCANAYIAFKLPLEAQ